MVQISGYQIIVLVGVVQALVLIVLLVTKRQNRSSNYLLAAILWLIGKMNIDDLLPDVTLVQKYPLLLLLFNVHIILLACLLYFYACSLTQASFRFDRRFWLFIALSFIVDTTLNAMIYYCLTTKDCSKSWLIGIAEVYDVIAIIAIATSLKLAFRNLQKYERLLQNQFTNLEKLTLRWLQKLLKYIGIVALYWMALAFIDIVFFNYQIYGWPYHIAGIALVLIIYWIGFSQYLRPQVVVVTEQGEPPPSPTSESVTPAKLSLSEPEMQQYTKVLKNAMTQEKLYLDASLNLASLAEHLNIPSKHISQTLNQFVGKNLNDFVNEYRVEDMKQKLLDKKYDHLTILGIAFEAGFNSKATFQRIFKKIVKLSPSEFKKQHQSI